MGDITKIVSIKKLKKKVYDYAFNDFLASHNAEITSVIINAYKNKALTTPISVIVKVSPHNRRISYAYRSGPENMFVPECYIVINLVELNNNLYFYSIRCGQVITQYQGKEFDLEIVVKSFLANNGVEVCLSNLVNYRYQNLDDAIGDILTKFWTTQFNPYPVNSNVFSTIGNMCFTIRIEDDKKIQ